MKYLEKSIDLAKSTTYKTICCNSILPPSDKFVFCKCRKVGVSGTKVVGDMMVLARVN